MAEHMAEGSTPVRRVIAANDPQGRSTGHAWSNPTDRPCLIAVSSHDGR